MRTLGAAVGAALLILTTAPAQAHGGGAPQARVWVTTPDRAEQLHERAPVTFTRGGSAETTITIDPGTRYQSMDGFGASLTDSAASVLYRLDPAARDRAMRSLFDPREGIGVGFLRQPVGSSDFTAAPAHYSYDDVPAGETDFALRHFSIAHDRAQILPLLRRARQLNPQLKIMGTPWSAPAWMKTSDSLIGGHLKDEPRIYDAYARYLVRYVREYARAGVPIDYLTVQNEPQNRHDGGYPGAAVPVGQAAKVIEALGPLLRRYSPRTRILGYDHNWATHPGDVGTTPPGEDPETDYPYRLLDSPARPVARRHRVPLLLGRTERADRAARGVPRQGHLVHRVLRLARRAGHPRADLPGHAHLARTDPGHRHHPQLGEVRGELEHRPGQHRRAAPGRLRHLHRPADPAPGRRGHPRRRVLHDRAPGEVREAGRVPRRQHLVRHHQLERPDHGRGVPQPGRLHRPGRAQRERRPAHLRGGRRRPLVRVHAARRRPCHVHLAPRPRYRP
nr:hypothetical protein GCM10020092_047860 [Actinoplanes digitatis]